MSVTPGLKTGEGAGRRVFSRVAVIAALVLSVLGVSAAPAMASTATQAISSAQPTGVLPTLGALPTYSYDDYGLAGRRYYFTKNESNLIATGAWFTVGYKLGGGYIAGLAAALGTQAAVDATNDGQCLSMRTQGMFGTWVYFLPYDC